MAKKWCPIEVHGDWCVLNRIETDDYYYKSFSTPATTKELISAFKLTTFFNELIDDKTIAIYVVGSRAIELNKPASDLDLIVILDDQEVKPEGRLAGFRLTYKGLPIHWKFYNYKELFYIDTAENPLAIFRQQICYTKPIPVYLDSRGKKLNDYLVKNQHYITTLGAKLVAFSYKPTLLRYKENLIQKTDIKKPLYNIVMTGEILSGKVDIEFIAKIKSATYRDYENLFSTGLISRLNNEMRELAEKVININYDELKKQANKVSADICNVINN